MAKVVAIGKQSFESIREKDNFYVDKTLFIREWWDSDDSVTLITRPRRFGKTLNMDMIKCFFSNEYKNRGDLFEGLDIWKDEKYRELQGTYPVIFLSFAEIKKNNFKDTKNDIISIINEAYKQHSYLIRSNVLTDAEKGIFDKFDNYSKDTDVSKEMSNEIVCRAIKDLSSMLCRHFGKKVIILLDEYDTPMQEAYVNGYWEELVGFTRSLFNSTFKTNPYLERAVMMETPFDMLVHCGDVEGREIFIEALVDCPCCIVSGNNDFFSDLPREEEIDIDGNKVLVTHGHYYGVSMDISGVAEEAKSRDCDAVFFGHTHKPVIEEIDGVLAINPGSLSYPRQHGRKPSYVILETDKDRKMSAEIKYL